MTDDQILAVAARLLTGAESSDLTMDRLAQASGVSRATLYRRFGSREAILQRLADEQGLEVQELARPGIPTRILQAARVTFARYGLTGATVEQIAQEAEVGVATVYRHYGSKEALIEAMIHASEPRQLLRNLTNGHQGDLETDLVALASTIVDFINANRDLIRITFVESQGSSPLLAQMRSTQGRTVTTLAAYLARQMEAGKLAQGDPFELALAFVGMLLGFTVIGPHFYERPVAEPESVARLVTRIFLNGLAEKQPQPEEHHL
jgi:AcrR family transcriptional regulator